jgi:hypothetical protein
MLTTNSPSGHRATKMTTCKECVHWTRSKDSYNHLPEDEMGKCDAIGGVIGVKYLGGAGVDYIETPFNFSCAAFDGKKETPYSRKKLRRENARARGLCE